MNRQAVYHEAKSRWAYAADAKTLHIRLRAAKGDLTNVTLTATDPFNWFEFEDGEHRFDRDGVFSSDMTKEGSDELFDYWFCEVTGIPTKRIRYSFVIGDGKEAVRYSARGFTENTGDFDGLLGWFNFPFINEEDLFTPPEWGENTVWYQIFCDRFCRSGGDTSVPWGSSDTKIHTTFFGGNLRGVMEKLPYIADLGFSGIYFTHLFLSPSTHKYDTVDYFQIDPQFGTNEEFRELVNEAHRLGIRIMLDAVFNHCAFEHPYFQDVVKNGKASPYYDCFHIHREPVLNFTLKDGKHIPKLTAKQQKELSFLTFAYTPHMPKWNTANATTRKLLIDAAVYWVREFGIDGWRLDVSNEVSHDFWRELRRKLSEIKPDVLLLGENWDDAQAWLNGDQFDSVMNYRFLSATVEFIGGKTDAEGFVTSLTREVLAAYPKPVQRLLFNILETHDTDRFLTATGNNPAAGLLGYVLLLTTAGSPSVYYGGEIGATGRSAGDENRRCMPWGEPIPPERDYREALRTLLQLRKSHPSFRSPDIRFLKTEGGLLAYQKETNGETLLVILNNSGDPVAFTPPEGAYTDAMTGRPQPSGTITVPSYGFYLMLNA
ncbi:MAG: alpha-glycosidase [Oscillospiraceae bacterium]|jgi:glycosidase|nr:alpha-glycosidase [Oscillospiraceae bacterium]